MRAVAAALSVALFAACGSDDPGPSANLDSGGEAGASASGPTSESYSPCLDAARAGRFSVELIPGSETTSASSQLAGGVYDAVDRSKLWQDVQVEGDCRLQVGPSLGCSRTCGSGESCDLDRCVPAPKLKSVGQLTLTGIETPLTLTPLPNRNDYYGPLAGGFPPFDAGALITLSAAGADVAGFSLAARGVSLLETPGTDLALELGEPLLVQWTPEGVDIGARVIITIDIAHHGGISAQLVCDVPDTGEANVPANLLNALVERGVAGFPGLRLTRRTASSQDAAPGCIEFSVSAGVSLSLSVPGVTSCDCAPGEACGQCPTEQTCQANLTCK